MLYKTNYLDNNYLQKSINYLIVSTILGYNISQNTSYKCKFNASLWYNICRYIFFYNLVSELLRKMSLCDFLCSKTIDVGLDRKCIFLIMLELLIVLLGFKQYIYFYFMQER